MLLRYYLDIFQTLFALIADALHNAGDVLAVVITFIALSLGVRTPTFKQTFGYMRAEMMAAFVNTMFLFITMICTAGSNKSFLQP